MIRASLARFAARFTMSALPLLLASAGGFAQDDEEDNEPFDRTPVDCVRVSSIDKTEAVDDQNILFHMRGDTVYRNHLPQRCPRLEHENRIAYRVFGGRLCSSDSITVIEDSVFGLQSGFTCGLGDFVPLSPEEVDDLRRQEEDLPAGADAIETEAVELDKPAAELPPDESSEEE